MSNFHRQLWKQKPQVWGPVDAVQAALRDRLERLGIAWENVVASFPLWNPGAWFDYSSNGYIGTSHNNVYCKNNALYCGGVDDDYAIIPGDNRVQIIGDITVSCVIKGSVRQSGYRKFIHCTGPSHNFSSSSNMLYVMGLENNSSGNVYVGHEYNTGVNQFRVFSTMLEDDKAYVLTATRDVAAKTWKLYVDGAHFGTYNYTNQANYGTSSDLYLAGYTDYHLDTHESFLGYMYQASIYFAALDATQIAELSDNPYQLWQPKSRIIYNIPQPASPSIGLSDLSHDQSLDSISLTQKNILSVFDLSQANAINELTLSVSELLHVVSMSQAQDVGGIDIIQVHNLITNNLLQSQNIGSVELLKAIVLEIASLVHVQSAGNLNINQVYVLSVDNVDHTHNLGSMNLTQACELFLSNLAHDHRLQSVTFTTVIGKVTMAFDIEAPQITFDME